MSRQWCALKEEHWNVWRVMIIMHVFKLKIDPDYLIFLLLWVALENMSWLLALPTIYNTWAVCGKENSKIQLKKTVYRILYIPRLSFWLCIRINEYRYTKTSHLHVLNRQRVCEEWWNTEMCSQ